MATSFLVQPIRGGNARDRNEKAFADALAKLRLALGALEAACEDDPARCRRSAAALERFVYEAERLASQDEVYGE